jgi:hypothetical protein
MWKGKVCCASFGGLVFVVTMSFMRLLKGNGSGNLQSNAILTQILRLMVWERV